MTVLPAYGRDYTSLKAAKADWNDNKDFVIADLFSGEDGRYINKEDAGTQNIMVRYKAKTQIGKLQ